MSHISFNIFSYLNFLGTMLAVLKNLHLVVGIVSLIIKVLGIVAVVQVALMGQQENISLGRSVETLLQCTIPFQKCKESAMLYFTCTTFSSFHLLIHLQKKTWLLMKILCHLLWQHVCAGRVSGRESVSSGMWEWGKCLRTATCSQLHKQSPLYGQLMTSGPSSILCLVCNSAHWPSCFSCAFTHRNDARSIHTCCTKGLEKYLCKCIN